MFFVIGVPWNSNQASHHPDAKIMILMESIVLLWFVGYFYCNKWMVFHFVVFLNFLSLFFFFTVRDMSTEKWKVKVKVTQSCLNLWDLMDCRVHPCGILQARILEWVAPFPSPGDLPNPGTEPRSLTLPVNSLPTEPQGKPKNTRVGSLFLLQRIFPTQESNGGLLHCRQLLYQLSYQGSQYVNYLLLNILIYEPYLFLPTIFKKIFLKSYC